MKIHIGCGKKKWDDYVNCDSCQDVEPDVLCGAESLSFEDESADEITAIHVFEHFWQEDIPAILDEWLRVLKPGGELILELPCLGKVLKLAYSIMSDASEKEAPDAFLKYVLFPLYGDPRTHKKDAANLHKWCYSMVDMQQILGEKLENIRFETPHFHIKERDMRVIANKPGND